MKRQYLGDSRDCFKWHYHNYLTSALGYPILNIILMLTKDDPSGQGKTDPRQFPGGKIIDETISKIIDFCNELRETKDIQRLAKLPCKTDAQYAIKLHKTEFQNTNRQEYFIGFNAENKQVLFLDPDIGFEPKNPTSKHVLYSDVERILKQIADDSVISVFQYQPQGKSFNEYFPLIKNHLPTVYTTAIYWKCIMFIAISKSKETVDKVININHQYSQKYPAKVLR